MSESKGEKKIQRHNVFIAQTLDATGRFNVSLSCPFTPTEVKVRAITFFDGTDIHIPFSLHSSNLGSSGGSYGTCFGSFMNPGIFHSGIIEPLTTFSPGSFTFYVLAGGEPTILAEGGILGIHLEFRRPG